MKWRQRASGFWELTDHGVVHGSVSPEGAWTVFPPNPTMGGNTAGDVDEAKRRVREIVANAQPKVPLHLQANYEAVRRGCARLPNVSMHLARGEVGTAAKLLESILDELVEVHEKLSVTELICNRLKVTRKDPT
jgi:hypothetical protein